MDKARKKSISVNKSELFAGLPRYVSKEVLSCAHSKTFVSGAVLFFAGETIDQVLLLTEGRVKKSHLNENGGEVIVRLSVPGELISSQSLVPGRRHSLTAQALQDCKVLAWESATFEAAMTCFPGLRRNAKRILECRLVELGRRFCEISTRTASPRLASGLVHLVGHIGRRVKKHIEINLSQEDLGQMTAMNSSSVCRLLNTWKSQGHVKLRKEIIEIHSVPRLRDLCRGR